MTGSLFWVFTVAAGRSGMSGACTEEMMRILRMTAFLLMA